MYEYACRVDRIVDGDTVDLTIDLGFDTYQKHRVRLFGIDAPEQRTRDLAEKERGLAATAFLTRMINENGSNMIVRTKLDRRGKFGRVLGTLFIGDLNLNALMVKHGHAEWKSY